MKLWMNGALSFVGWLSFEKLWVRPSAALREKVNRNEND
jgi:hypothetical protein